MRIALILFISTLILSCQTKEPAKEEKKETRKVEEVVEHYPDGKKKMEGKLVNGERHGAWKYYHKNGFLWSEGDYWYGTRKGYSAVYHENGKMKLEGLYKNDLKVGKWKLWAEDGTLMKEIDMDQLLSSDDSLKLELK